MHSKTKNALDKLLKHDLIKAENVQKLGQVIDQFSFNITKQIIKQINNTDDPVAKQFIPHEAELNISKNESVDPIGDEKFSPVKGIVHRYPDRCLLLPILVCPVYCRFCFRRENVSKKGHTLSANELETAIAYVASNNTIWEVILSGGDPFILPISILKKLIQRISAIPHVAIIRIHTRVPVVYPEKITNDLLSVLQNGSTIYVVLHANHSQEFSEEARQACAKIINAGVPMLSQTVLLRGVNDDISSLSDLMRCFVRNRIKPYYLHHADLAQGTAHFRTTISQGLHLVKELRGRLSGLCQPTYVLDIPGGFGKVPLGPNYLTEGTDGYLVTDYLGEVHEYDEYNW